MSIYFDREGTAGERRRRDGGDWVIEKCLSLIWVMSICLLLCGHDVSSFVGFHVAFLLPSETWGRDSLCPRQNWTESKPSHVDNLDVSTLETLDWVQTLNCYVSLTCVGMGGMSYKEEIIT
jgi:hypothetical protein